MDTLYPLACVDLTYSLTSHGEDRIVCSYMSAVRRDTNLWVRLLVSIHWLC